MRRFVAILFLLVFIPFAYSQTNDEKSIESKIDEIFAEFDSLDSPGVAVAVIRDGLVIYRKGYGSAQLEYGVPISPSTIFHVASVSKQFTAMAITMLAEQGKLSLDDDIHKYLPYVPDFGDKITVKHLLHHTSGLRDQWELTAMSGGRLDDVISQEHIRNLVRNQKELNFEPGAEFLYCNTGYTLLAEIVKEVSGTPFPEWCKQNIFMPLGMTNSHFHDDYRTVVKNRAYSYSGNKKNGFRNRALSYSNVGATSLFTTVEDLANWMLNFEVMKVGGAEVIALMQTTERLNNGNDNSYAHGILVGKYRGLRTLSHSGSDAGFRSELIYFSDQRFGVVVLGNYSGSNPNGKARRIADIYLEDVFTEQQAEEKSPERTAVEIDPDLLDNYVGRFEFKDWIVVTFTREDEQFLAEAPGFAKKELLPMSENEFFMKDANVLFTFEKVEGDKANNLTLLMQGTERPGTRLHDSSPTREMLEEYTGRYFSEELETIYTVKLKDDGLVAAHRRHGDIPLEFNKTDSFIGDEWFFSRIEFTRNGENQIDGFLLTGSRVRNLRFDKVKFD